MREEERTETLSSLPPRAPLPPPPLSLHFKCLHIGNSQPVSAGYTHFITSPVSKDATGTLPLRNLQVITDSYGQTVVAPQKKPTGAENSGL